MYHCCRAVCIHVLVLFTRVWLICVFLTEMSRKFIFYSKILQKTRSRQCSLCCKDIFGLHYMIIYISVQLWCLCFNELLCVLFCAWGWDVLIDVIGSTASILIPCFTLRVLTAAHHASTISEAIERVSSSPQAQPPCSYFNVCVHRNIIHVILCQHQYLLWLIHLEHGDFCRW